MIKRSKFIKTTALTALGVMTGASILNSCKKEEVVSERITKLSSEAKVYSLLVLTEQSIETDDAFLKKFGTNRVIKGKLQQLVKIKNSKELPLGFTERSMHRKYAGGADVFKHLTDDNGKEYQLIDLPKPATIKLPVSKEGKLHPSLNCEIVNQIDLEQYIPKKTVSAYKKSVLTYKKISNGTV